MAAVRGHGVRGRTAAGRPALDVPAAVSAALAASGAAEVAGVDACTACAGGYFSHRARGDRRAPGPGRLVGPRARPRVSGRDGRPTGAGFAERLDAVRDRIGSASADPGSVRIVAVTKGFGVDAVASALAAGLTDIGENYADELVAKARRRWQTEPVQGPVRVDGRNRSARCGTSWGPCSGTRWPGWPRG